jgi:hypothetical protein
MAEAAHILSVSCRICANLLSIMLLEAGHDGWCGWPDAELQGWLWLRTIDSRTGSGRLF